jgi:predicted nucleic-acid-binding protein
LKAVDTNVLVRLVVKDDVAQLSRARAYCSSGVIVPLTVSLESEWVLRSRYKLSREKIVRTLLAFMGNANFHFSKEAGVRWALDRYRAGADFADMIHLVDAHDADGFATFDEDFARDAGNAAPLPVIAI